MKVDVNLTTKLVTVSKDDGTSFGFSAEFIETMFKLRKSGKKITFENDGADHTVMLWAGMDAYQRLTEFTGRGDPKMINGWWLPEADFHITDPIDNFNTSILDKALPYVKDFSLAVDCGAHVGVWTKTLLKHFKTVVAFEPSMEAQQCFKLNLAHEVDDKYADLQGYGIGKGVCRAIRKYTKHRSRKG